MALEINRRRALEGLGALAFAGFASGANASTSSTLGSAANGVGVLFGAAAGNQIYTDAAYANLFREANLITSEWQFKMAALQPTRGVYEYWHADNLLAYTTRTGKKLKAHCGFWRAFNPAWMTGLSTSELQYIFDKHIDTVVPRYAGRVYAWDVANEPFWPADNLPGGFGDGPWYQAYGAGWIERAFRRVSALDPSARLYLNEAQCDNNGAGLGPVIRPALLQLVDRLKNAGVPIYGVGLESHLDMGMAYDDGQFGVYCGQLANKGVKIAISELDVRDFTLPDDTASRDKLIAARIQGFLTQALAVPAVDQIVTWGLSDKYGWLKALWQEQHGSTVRQPRPLLFDENMQKKPAWTAVSNALHSRRRA